VRLKICRPWRTGIRMLRVARYMQKICTYSLSKWQFHSCYRSSVSCPLVKYLESKKYITYKTNNSQRQKILVYVAGILFKIWAKNVLPAATISKVLTPCCKL
jgi:hypothetical protein